MGALVSGAHVAACDGLAAAFMLAAAVGSLVGGRSDIATLVAGVGLGVLAVLVIFWSYAKTFGRGR
jgi:hypothetical protein